MKKLARLARKRVAYLVLESLASDLVKLAKNGMKVSMGLAVISMKSAVERGVSTAK